MKEIEITRIYSDEAGESRFDDIRIPLTSDGTIGSLSDPEEVESITFRVVDKDYDYDFHQAPVRQYVILLDGEIEVETSLGEKRQFKGGDILLIEDINGKGHKTRNLVPIERRSVFVTLKNV